MDLNEKVLYHQIHPAKLLTDWGTLPLALYLFWRHRWRLALIVAFVPSMIASYLLIRCADLEPYKQSRFGQYVARSMTRSMEGVRLVGAGLMMLVAWKRCRWLLPVGLLIILAAWLRGMFLPKAALDLTRRAGRHTPWR
jgi:putative flippase GtrA